MEYAKWLPLYWFLVILEAFSKYVAYHHIFLLKQIAIIRASNLMNSISSKRWNVWIEKLEYFVYICIHWSKEGTIE